MQDADAVTDDLRHVAIDNGGAGDTCMENVGASKHASVSRIKTLAMALVVIYAGASGNGSGDDNPMDEGREQAEGDESDFTDEEEDREVCSLFKHVM